MPAPCLFMENLMALAYDGPIFDCDTHWYETDNAWDQFVPAQYRDDWRIQFKVAQDGDWALHVGPTKVEVSAGHLKADGRVPAPGKLHDWLRAQKEGRDQIDFFVPVSPDMIDPAARLKKMDEFGVEGCVIFPGHFIATVSYYDDPEVGAAIFHGHNEWVRDTWSFNYRDRIYPTPLLRLDNLELAIKEAEWVAKEGAKVVVMPMGPVNGKSPAHPDHDRFWNILNEAGIKVTFHVSEADYLKHHMALWGEKARQPRLKQTAFLWMHGFSERPVVETLSSFIFHNFFARFPNIKLCSAENGAEWVPAMLLKMDKCRGMAKNGYWPCGQLKDRPSNIFKENVLVVAYPEDDIAGIIEQAGDHRFLVMGSDYPHSEGVPTPRDFFTEACAGLSPEVARAIMYDNGKRFFQPQAA